MSDALATYKNKTYGIEVRVKAHPRGFTVTLWDVEADEYITSNLVHATLEAAKKAAKKIAT